ncbi:MAG: sulfatase-like hydrolase/transferase [Ferruginibacter sp.]|nr:sulfatase-like hydrolase/transferase [Cytophagales bacterium]
MFCSTYAQLKKSVILIILTIFVYANAQSQRPNIIFIMTDDMGYGDLSGYGRKEYLTPSLDKLASQGMKFVNAYSAGPLCTPTRTALMTGRYPARTPVGLIEPLTSTKRDSIFGLTSDYPSVATLMKAGGYETALVGKWHLGFLPHHRPVKNGFDYFFGIHTGAADYISHKGDGRTHDLYENDTPVYPEGYLTDLFSQKAVAFIKQKHNKPFFLTITYTAPHWPWQGSNDKPYADSIDFRKGGSPAVYAEMMRSLDDGVQSIMKTLDDEQLSNQTMVIFTNDNGGERYSDNGGLTNAKGTLWEGGIRVPAFVRWTGKINPGVITQQVAITMDWTATILSLGEANAHRRFPLDGIDLMPILTGAKKTIERTIYWRTFQRSKQKAIRDGNWKYLQDEKGEYLFNLAADQKEKNDLKAKEETIFTFLKEKYAKWEKTVLKPIPL